MKSTYSLDIIIDTLCKNDKEVDIIKTALLNAVSVYQWKYQNADDKRYRDVYNSAQLNISKAAKLMRSVGDNQLAEKLEKKLKYMTLTKNDVLEDATELMKNELLDNGMTKRKHKDKFSNFLKLAFIEWCEEYKLKKPQFYLNS